MTVDKRKIEGDTAGDNRDWGLQRSIDQIWQKLDGRAIGACQWLACIHESPDMLVILIMHFGASTLQVDGIQEVTRLGRAGDELRLQHEEEARRRGADKISGRKKMVRLFCVGNCLFAGSFTGLKAKNGIILMITVEKQIICPKEKRTPGGVSPRWVKNQVLGLYRHLFLTEVKDEDKTAHT
ncbi:hypothetical protein B0H17DRAFT_1184481 [Mycena rosella]|uniref:Uncharacterized protein n=1 Tax=Mycena rosella TaxID=1033263 RepID=A0AAD7CZB6_MYCRO|nr:hypothetical protein B0H17DRAFT_1184481 [Mycena rosella]